MEKTMIRASHVAITFLVMFFQTAPVLGQDMSCLNQLYPCLNYLLRTQQPPATCCEPLTDLIKSNVQCLCDLISNQGSFVGQFMAGINVTAVQALPGKCGQNLNPLTCLSSPPSIFGSSDQSSSSASYSYAAATVLLPIISWLFMLK